VYPASSYVSCHACKLTFCATREHDFFLQAAAAPSDKDKDKEGKKGSVGGGSDATQGMGASSAGKPPVPPGESGGKEEGGGGVGSKGDAGGGGKGGDDNMIVIHVCDEGRRLTHDFRCPKHVLLSEMAYFRSYLDGTESADDIDISVHCDMQVRGFNRGMVPQKGFGGWGLGCAGEKSQSKSCAKGMGLMSSM
jgi:hypothetical protein